MEWAVTVTEILTYIVLALAFIGYVTCLSRLFWVTVLVTAGLVFYCSRSFPFVPENTITWGIVGGVGAAALLAAFLTPQQVVPSQNSRPKGQNHPKKVSKRRKRTPAKAKPRAPQQREVVIDGTNVMYWDGEPDLRTLRHVVDKLRSKNLLPFVFFDASARHHLGDRSLNAKGFAMALGLKQNRVRVCPAQTDADAFILSYAKENNLPVVSNDRFGDRAAQVKGLKLIKGVVANGKPILHGL